MKIAKSRRRHAGVCLAMALLTGCAGAGSPLSLRPVSDQFEAGSCKSDHGVSVKPCVVELTLEQPKVDLTTTGPKGGTFTYNDTKCDSKGIAEVSGKNNHYVVTAGSISGECAATFTDKESSGKTIGTAAAAITNYKRDHCPPTCEVKSQRARAFEYAPLHAPTSR